MLIKKMQIPRKLLSSLIDIARERGKKEEVAGVLIGKVINSVARVEDFEAGENILHSPTRFEINPVQLYEIILGAEERGLEIVGFWHTHIGDPSPSYIDLRYMKLWPVVWLIIDSLSGDFTASIYIKDQLKNVEVELID